MKTNFLTLLFLLSILNTFVAQTIYPDYLDGRIFLKVKEEAHVELPHFDSTATRNHYPYLRSIIESFEMTLIYKPLTRIKTPVFENTYEIHFNKHANVDQLIARLEQFAFVDYVEKIPLFKSTFIPNDPYSQNNEQWALAITSAYEAFDIHSDGEDVVVAIVDDAVMHFHDDVLGYLDLDNPNIWINQIELDGEVGVDDDGNGYIDDSFGWDAADEDEDPFPPIDLVESFFFSHGTHVAGIAGAETNNGEGVASISFNNVDIMACKTVTDYDPPTFSDGSLILTHVHKGLEYAIVNNADIINCSWGVDGNSATIQNLINEAISKGILVVAAAGNDNSNVPIYPAGYTNVIAVASTNVDDFKSSFSNFGSWVDIAAPGTNIISTVQDGNDINAYASYNGTSMSSPMVAGLLAHMKSFHPTASNHQLLECLYSSADNIDFENPNYVGQLGAGRINAQLALVCLGGIIPCENNYVLIEIVLDDFGSETTWELVDGNNNVVASGGPYWDNVGGTIISQQYCLEGDDYSFNIYDSGGDGICCDHGEGSFEVTDAQGNILLSGAQFGSGESHGFSFIQIDNCPAPNGLYAYEIGYSHVWLDWEELPGVNEYQTRFREVGSSTWVEGNWFSTAGVIWANLDPCKEYEFQVRTNCGGLGGSFSTPITIFTPGCGDPFCYSYGLTWDDWIDRVQIGSIDNQSGNDYGYGAYTDLTTTLTAGENYSITLSPSTDDNVQTVYWRVWIDFNQDDDFEDSGEMVLEISNTNIQVISETISLPANIPQGTTRLRISMNLDGYADPCDAYEFREVEDYSVFIDSDCIIPEQPVLQPNGIISLCEGETVSVTASSGCSDCTLEWSNGQVGSTVIFNTSGIYTVVATNDCGMSPPSESVEVVVSQIPVTPLITTNGPTELCPGEQVILSAANICTGCMVTWSNGQTSSSITVMDEGTYSATYSNSCGTSLSSDIINITVLSAPEIPTISASGSLALCPGENVSLSAENVCNNCEVHWSNGEIASSLTVSIAGNYSAYVYDPFCDLESGNSTSITVTIEDFSPTPELNISGTHFICEGDQLTVSVTNICEGCTVTWSDGTTDPFLIIIEEGIYSATMFNTCEIESNPSQPLNIEITTFPPQAVIVPSGPIEICTGQSIELNANGCDTCDEVIWSNGMSGSSIMVSEAGAYTAAFQNACGLGVESEPVEVEVSTYTPQVSVNSQCILSAPEGSDYQWFFEGDLIGSGQFLTATDTGFYSLIMTNLDGCVGSSPLIYIDFCVNATKVEEITTLSGLMIYPNPTNDEFWLSFELSERTNLTIEFMAINGQYLQAIYHGRLAIGNHQIKWDVSSYPSGVYLYRFISDTGIKVGRLVVQH